MRVISDDGDVLVGWLPIGTTVLRGTLADGSDLRTAPLAERFRLPRGHRIGRWHRYHTLRRIPESESSSVCWFFTAAGEFCGWYVNLEIPRGRADHAVDRIDGVLDVWIDPDGRWRWKDEDELDAAIDAGRFTPEQAVAFRAEGERQIAQARRGAFPFDGTFCDFRPDPGWAPPQLPEQYR